MPIYEYQTTGAHCCEHCKVSFEAMQRLSDAPLKICPECHHPVQRKLSRPNISKSAPSLSRENIEKHGFTQFKKTGKGVYEKTAGKGPDIISDKILRK